MTRNIRRRITFANVTATLALLFATSGGAYAAGKILITSTKQISPKVLKSLKGTSGKNGTQGATGPAGPAGPTGPAGAKGETGTPGPEGKEGKAGASVTSKTLAAGDTNCPAGGSEFKAGSASSYACNGSPWTAGGTLPKGSSETGVWTEPQAIEYPTGEPEFIFVSISFAIPLTAELEANNVHFIEAHGPVPAGCKGSVETPEAEPGNLCIFASVNEGNGTGSTFNPTFINPTGNTPAVAGRTGTLLSFELDEAKEEPATASGTWAVTGG